jgi:hypothetical protein
MAARAILILMVVTHVPAPQDMKETNAKLISMNVQVIHA